MKEDKYDIIIPVYNSWDYVTACIESVIKYTEYLFSIIIVDDRSDSYVRQELGHYEREHSYIKVLYSEENLEFVHKSRSI